MTSWFLGRTQQLSQTSWALFTFYRIFISIAILLTRKIILRFLKIKDKKTCFLPCDFKQFASVFVFIKVLTKLFAEQNNIDLDAVYLGK